MKILMFPNGDTKPCLLSCQKLSEYFRCREVCFLGSVWADEMAEWVRWEGTSGGRWSDLPLWAGL